MLKVSNLAYSVNDTTILDDVSIAINKGEFVGIIGPNGSGKSTLIRNICKHVTPNKGEISVCDMDINSISNKKLAAMLSLVSQENETPFDFTVFDVLQMGRYHKKGLFEAQNDEDKLIIRDALDKVGLNNFEKRSFLSLSGGEKQRVLIARALVQDTNIIVLDEPTNHLDIGSVLSTLKMLRSSGKTIVVALHDLSIASKYCDRIYVLNGGAVICKGAPLDVINKDLIRELYNIECEVFNYKNNIYLNFLD